VTAPAPTLTCSRAGCFRTATVHCEDCGAPICPQHTAFQGSLSQLRHTCGKCLGSPSLPLKAVTLPEPPPASGPFEKLPAPPRPSRQPWVRDLRERKVRRSLESEPVVVVPPPPARAPPEPMPPAPKKRETPFERHRRECREQAAAKRERATSDLAWMKQQCREVFFLLAAHRTLDAMAYLDALCGMPKKLSPSAAPVDAEAWVARRRAERLVYLMQQTGEGACT
jgi:hypothetical protein